MSLYRVRPLSEDESRLRKQGFLPTLHDYKSVIPEVTQFPNLVFYELDHGAQTLTHHVGLNWLDSNPIRRRSIPNEFTRDLFAALKVSVDSRRQSIKARNRAAFQAVDWPFNGRRFSGDYTPEEWAEFEESELNLLRWSAVDKVITAELNPT